MQRSRKTILINDKYCGTTDGVSLMQFICRRSDCSNQLFFQGAGRIECRCGFVNNVELFEREGASERIQNAASNSKG